MKFQKFSEWLVTEKKWIKKAIKKPGSLTAAADTEGKSIADYCKEPPSDKAKKRCNLWKTLKGLHNKK